MNTKIQYVQKTWNPIVGCKKVSPGCAHCYAEKMAYRICMMSEHSKGPNSNSKYHMVIDKEAKGWGRGDTCFWRNDLLDPLSWKTPCMVFVISMGDLFYERVDFEWVDAIMAIMVATNHTYLILTKRPERMKEYFSQSRGKLMEDILNAGIDIMPDENGIAAINNRLFHNFSRPYLSPNIWLGVTAENQQMANQRIPILLDIPAAKHYVSVEPMLEAVDLTKIKKITFTGTLNINALAGIQYYPEIDTNKYDISCGKLDWVICGCESGPGHRPMDIDWARSLKNHCELNKVPFFLKQAYSGHKKISMPVLDGKIWDQIPDNPTKR